MSRGWMAIALMAATLAQLMAADALAQESDAVHVFLKRVKLAAEERDELEDPDDAAAETLSIIQQIASSATPRVTLGFETAILQVAADQATDRYENILAQYRQQLQEDEDRLVRRPLRQPRASLGVTNRDAHALVQDWMLRLPPTILDLYQDRIDADAKRLLDAGLTTNDPTPLRRLAVEFRASRSADLALGHLGDLAFERGDFDLALHWWRRIVPLPSSELVNRRGGEPKRVRHGVDIVRVHAKQVLALAFAGRPEAIHERDAFQSLYPEDRGSFAGKFDAYHIILTEWIDALKRQPPQGADHDWPTLAGAANRNRILGKSLNPRLWLDGPAWKAPLPTINAGEAVPLWLSATRSLAIPPTPLHPVIAHGQVLISDGHAVTSFDLLTGKQRFRIANGVPFVRRDDPKPVAERAFSLSVGKDRAFACLGLRPGDVRPRRLTAIDLVAERRFDHTIWSANAAVTDILSVYFDSDPLVVGDRVYVGVMGVGNDRAVRELACFDSSGAHLWQTRIATFPEQADANPTRPSLLVGTGTAIVDATNAGVVTAVDAWTGRRLWAFRYPAAEPASAATSPRGAISCLAADGKIYLAPADSASLYCLDAETGEALWERPWSKRPGDIVIGPPSASDVVELLGVVGNRLIFTDRHGLCALDARTGWSLEWQQPVQGKLPSLGRGLMAGPWVFWPTADPEVSWRAVGALDGALRQAGASPEYYELTTLRGLPGGNAAFANGCLVIAGERELVAYVPAAKHLPQTESDPQARTSPTHLYSLALLHLETGRDAFSKSALRELQSRVSPKEFDNWNHLLRERTSSKSATSPAIPRERVPRLVPPTSGDVPGLPTFTKLKATWGPLHGIAPPMKILGDSRAADLTVVIDGREAVFVSSRDGKERFRQPLRYAGVQWIGRDERTLIVAGSEGVEAFDIAARAPVWHVPSSALASRQWRLVDGTPTLLTDAGRFSDFQFLGRSLVCRDGDHTLLAIDPETGARQAERTVDEIRALEGGATIPPAGRWASAEADAGQILDASVAAWRGEPSPIDLAESRRRMVPLGGAWRIRGETHGRVRLTALGGSPEKYGVHQPPWPTSLTGGPAHVLGDDSVCLALIPRNHGFELTSLEPRPGLRSLWTLPPTELRNGFDVLAAAWDERAVYFVHAGQLQARSLANGRVLWTVPLPKTSGAWRVEQWGGQLVVWPQSTAGIPALTGPGDPWTSAVALLAGRRGIGSVPILLVDPKTGAEFDRVLVPHAGGPVFVSGQPNQIVVTADGKVRAFAGVP